MVTLLDILTLIGIGLSFIGSLILAHRGLSSYRNRLQEFEKRNIEQLRHGREKLVENGVLEPGDAGFNFLSDRVQEHVDGRLEISRFEMPDNSGVFPRIDVLTVDGDRFEGALNAATYINWNEERAADLRKRADDSKILLGAVFLAAGFLLQGLGFGISNLVI